MPEGFDFSELNQLAADLGEVRGNLGPFLNSAVQFTSREIKKDAAKKVGKRKYFKSAAAAIDYDINVSHSIASSQIESEIGYNKSSGGGKLGNLVEFGAPNAIPHMNVRSHGRWISIRVPGASPRPLPPGNELSTALHDNEKDFVKGISDASADAEREAGL